MQSTRNLMLIFLIEAVLVASPAVVQAQFTLATNNGTINITGYTGSDGTIVVPNWTNGYPVTAIGASAFSRNFIVTNVVIADGITTIGDEAFALCINLNCVTFPQSVTDIGDLAFWSCGITTLALPASVARLGYGVFAYCTSLTNAQIADGVNKISPQMFYTCEQLANITIPNSVTSVGNNAFAYCANLTNITIPSSVKSIDRDAFDFCTNLSGVYFSGNAPSITLLIFSDTKTTVYYLPGTSGWDTWGLNYGGAPTALWHQPYPIILADTGILGIRTNQFGFTISWATNAPIVVDACANLLNPNWQPVQTNMLTTGTSYFSDPQWTNNARQFYRLRSP